jgi:hypothetical protein
VDKELKVLKEHKGLQTQLQVHKVLKVHKADKELKVHKGQQ